MTHWHSARTRTAALASLVSAMAIVVSGCGATAATPTAAVAGASTTGTSGASAVSGGGSITLGDLHPFTGNYASVGAHSYGGVKAAVTCINAAGGVLGKQVNIATADTVGDPADAVPALNKMLAVNHPVGIIGPGGLEIGAAQPILDSHKMPFMFEGGLSAKDNNNDQYLWRDTPSDSQEGIAMAVYAQSKGYKSAAFMFSTIQSAQDFKTPVKAAWTKLGGTVVADINLSPGQTSYRSEVLRVVNAHPDVIFTQMEPQTAAPVFSGMKELDNLAIPFIASDTSAGPDWIGAIGAQVAHEHLVSVQGSSAPGPGGDTFNKCFAQANNNQQPYSNSNYAYDGATVLALAIQAAGTTDSAKVIQEIPAVSTPGTGKTTVTSYADGLAALKSGKQINYDGAGTTMDFNQYHNVYGPFDVVQWDPASSKFVTIKTVTGQQLEQAAGG